MKNMTVLAASPNNMAVVTSNQNGDCIKGIIPNYNLWSKSMAVYLEELKRTVDLWW